MIEVQKDHSAITDWFHSHGYLLYNVNHQLIDSVPDGVSNIFALHPLYHADRLQSWVRKD